MSAGHRLAASVLALALGLSAACIGHAQPGPGDLRAAYQDQVDRRLELPPEESLRYGRLALDALAAAGADPGMPQYVALVDRSPKVQAIFIYWLAPAASPELIGASPVSTGRGGESTISRRRWASSSTRPRIRISAPKALSTRTASAATASPACGSSISAGSRPSGFGARAA